MSGEIGENTSLITSLKLSGMVQEHLCCQVITDSRSLKECWRQWVLDRGFCLESTITTSTRIASILLKYWRPPSLKILMLLAQIFTEQSKVGTLSYMECKKPLLQYSTLLRANKITSFPKQPQEAFPHILLETTPKSKLRLETEPSSKDLLKFLSFHIWSMKVQNGPSQLGRVPAICRVKSITQDTRNLSMWPVGNGLMMDWETTSKLNLIWPRLKLRTWPSMRIMITLMSSLLRSLVALNKRLLGRQSCFNRCILFKLLVLQHLTITCQESYIFPIWWWNHSKT